MKYYVVAKRLRRLEGKQVTKKFTIQYRETKNFPNDLMEKIYMVIRKMKYNHRDFNYHAKPETIVEA